MKYQTLSSYERVEIEVLLKEGYTQSEIARKLRRNQSTISREVHRSYRRQDVHFDLNLFPYDASYADRVAVENKRLRGVKTKATKARVKKIENYLMKDWSPQQITMGVKNIGVSTVTIYSWIYQGRFENFTENDLYFGRRPRKVKYMPKARPDKSLFVTHSIDNRPALVNSRQQFGHWEADGVEVINSKKIIYTFVERKTRLFAAVLVPDKTFSSVKLAVDTFMSQYEDSVKSITTDRGSEFTSYAFIRLLKHEYNVKIWYSHAYSPQERGTNENRNGRLRRYVPKRKVQRKVTQNIVSYGVRRMNNAPMGVLGWKSPQHQFEKARKAMLKAKK
ncbi:IS30 family transposase [Periweissella cryptocerci]|nr:IS30 family transposase [Periweissella cryptocerci]